MSDGETEKFGQLTNNDQIMPLHINEHVSLDTQEQYASYREVQNGKVYDKLLPNESINLAAFGSIYLEIDVDNLALEKVTAGSIEHMWEKASSQWTEQCKALNIKINPFTVFKYYLIQRKAFSVLGKPTENDEHRRQKMIDANDHVKISEMKDNAMCSEYATLTAYMAQKVGESAHLIIGSALVGDDQWREAHAYVWVDGENILFDPVLAQQENEFPAIMVPEHQATLQDMEEGFDIEATRIGTEFSRIYGLEAGGFGARLKKD